MAICCLEPDGRTDFKKQLCRRRWPHFYAFDVLSIDGTDVTALQLPERKRRLLRIMPTIETRLLYLDHIEQRGCDLFRVACERDLEGIVGKWSRGTYRTWWPRHVLAEDQESRSHADARPARAVRITSIRRAASTNLDTPRPRVAGALATCGDVTSARLPHSDPGRRPERPWGAIAPAVLAAPLNTDVNSRHACTRAVAERR